MICLVRNCVVYGSYLSALDAVSQFHVNLCQQDTLHYTIVLHISDCWDRKENLINDILTLQNRLLFSSMCPQFPKQYE